MKPYQHFTLTERESLAEKIKKGKSNNQIAKEMGRHRSTIGREIKRNYSKKANHYNAWHGTCLSTRALGSLQFNLVRIYTTIFLNV